LLAKAVGQTTWLRLIHRVRQQAGSYRGIAVCQTPSIYEQNRIRGHSRAYALLRLRQRLRRRAIQKNPGP
jgi:hypothetical protein